jgi:hypothetical protein
MLQVFRSRASQDRETRGFETIPSRSANSLLLLFAREEVSKGHSVNESIDGVVSMEGGVCLSNKRDFGVSEK